MFDFFDSVGGDLIATKTINWRKLNRKASSNVENSTTPLNGIQFILVSDCLRLYLNIFRVLCVCVCSCKLYADDA